MESWSEPIPSDFTIRIFLDTNILNFYIDKEYESLNRTLEILAESPFTVLLCSDAVLLELANVRKRLHHIKAVENKFATAMTSKKFKDRVPRSLQRILKLISPSLLPLSNTLDIEKIYKEIKRTEDCRELPYKEIKDDVKTKVRNEINDLKRDPKIQYDNNKFHEKMFEKSFEICLSSTISRHDSLVLISALLPEIRKRESHILILTKDKDFTTAFRDFDLKSILENLELIKPNIERITSLFLASGIRTHLDLTRTNTDEHIYNFWTKKLIELILEKNKEIFLGYTYVPNDLRASPDNCVDFKLQANTPLENDINLTIISRDLDFVYNVKVPVKEFWNNSPITKYPFTHNDVRNISFKSLDFDGDNKVPTKPEIICRLRENGHFVFVQPE